MGRGIITSPQKKNKSGPVEIIINNTLQPGWEKYISTPIVQVSGFNGTQISRGTTSCKTWWPDGWGTGTDEDPLYGNMHSLVRINFTNNCIGRLCTVYWWAKGSARVGASIRIHHTNGTIYYHEGAGGDLTNRGATSTFMIDKENFWLIVRGDWDGSTSVWSPSTSASVGYLSLQ